MLKVTRYGNSVYEVYKWRVDYDLPIKQNVKGRLQDSYNYISGFAWLKTRKQVRTFIRYIKAYANNCGEV